MRQKFSTLIHFVLMIALVLGLVVTPFNASAQSSDGARTVAEEGKPRIIWLTSPANGSVYTAPASIVLTAVLTDTTNSVGKVAFILNNTSKLWESSTPPYTFTWSGVNPGNYVVGAYAYDKNGVKLTNANFAGVKVLAPGVPTPTPTATTVPGSTPAPVPTMPPSPTATPTPASALFTLTVNNGTGSGSYTAGTTVNITAAPPPADQVFLQWSGASVANVTAMTTTLTMPAANAGITATYGPDQIVPQPVASHPRLWVTVDDLPRLRAWASPTNPIYANGFQPALTYAINRTNAHWNWQTGLPGPGWQDSGSALFPGDGTEAYAEFFAFASLIDPNPANRDLYAQRARTLLMYVMNQAVQGPAAGQPFRDPQFATYDRSRTGGEAFGLTVDWIYPYLSAQDKATIRKVFLRWAEEQLTAYNHPVPLGVTNHPSLLGGQHGPRWAANNYFSGHMRHLVLMSLSFDPADDPAINPALSSITLGNTLRSYLLNATGAWLYEQYAIYEDANVVSPIYNVPTSGLGIASGGLSVEGSMYGDSLAYVQEALLALHTAGFHDETLSGPQIKLTDSTYWDKVLDGFLHSLAPIAQVDPAQAYMGPIYQMASHGDLLRFWVAPHEFPVYGALGVYDFLTGNTQRLAKGRWIAANAIQGGIDKLAERAGGNIWSNNEATNAILYFLMFDPAVDAQSIPDPRPALPTTFSMPAIGRILARTDWSANASWFTYKCGWLTINHQNGDCNQFEFYRKGEWLTKERSGYANDMILMTSDYHNTLALQNTATSGTTQPYLQFFEVETWQRGGQWTNGQNAGDPTVITSFGNNYIATTGISTNLYNRPDQWNPGNSIVDILHASRSLVWLKPDTIVVYDRATSKTANRFKRFNLVLTGDTTVNGKLATEVTPKGQQLFIRNLLPMTTTLTVLPAENFNLVAQGEPSRFRLVVEDASNPSDVRFLHVLEGADAGATPTAVQLVQSRSGAPFEGAVIGNTAVLFPVNLNNAGNTSYLVPMLATNHLVTGLTPGGAYDVDVLLTGSNVVIVVKANGSMYTADSGGVLNFDTSTIRPSDLEEETTTAANTLFLPLVTVAK
ncbi:MAG: Ig-like domain-containing protein [Caldilineaceae bacterium]